MYVYVDLFLGLNLALNACIMVMTAKLCNERVYWLRLIFAAGAGGIYALGALYHDWGLFYSTPVKFLVSLGLVQIAFCPKTVYSLLRITAAYYITCFVTGGAVAACYYYHQSFFSSLVNPISTSLSWVELFTGTVLTFLLLLAVKSGYLTIMMRKTIEYLVEIEYCGKKLNVNSILDTGNTLYSASRKPVIVVEYQKIKEILGAEARAFFENCQPEDWLETLHLCEDKEWLSRVQLIPFRALAGKSMLIAFRPSIVRIRSEGLIVETSDVIVGIYAGKFSASGQYAALLHPAILKLSVREEVKTCASPG